MVLCIVCPTQSEICGVKMRSILPFKGSYVRLALKPDLTL